MPGMKICVTGTRGFPGVQGGVETHCQQLYPKLAAMGTDVTVFTRTPYLNRPFRTQWQGVKFSNLPCPKRTSLEAILHTLLALILAKLKSPNIIHIHAIGPCLLVPLAKAIGLKVVITHHGPDYQRAKWGKVAKAMLMLGERWGCKYADQIIAISSDIKSHIEEKFGRQAQLVPNGVVISPKSKGTDYIKGIALVPDKYILAVARFVPEKGLEHLIAAFGSLETNWKLVIAGDADHQTPYSRGLKSLAQKTKGVVLTGFITGEPLEQLYSHAGLFVLPSYFEGLPIVLLEALSYGLSVLVSDIPANKEVALDKDRYFPPGNESILATKLDYWMNRGPLTDDQRTGQLEMVRQKYNWDNVAQQVLQIYEQTCHQQNHLTSQKRV